MEKKIDKIGFIGILIFIFSISILPGHGQAAGELSEKDIISIATNEVSSSEHIDVKRFTLENTYMIYDKGNKIIDG